MLCYILYEFDIFKTITTQLKKHNGICISNKWKFIMVFVILTKWLCSLSAGWCLGRFSLTTDGSSQFGAVKTQTSFAVVLLFSHVSTFFYEKCTGCLLWSLPNIIKLKIVKCIFAIGATIFYLKFEEKKLRPSILSFSSNCSIKVTSWLLMVVLWRVLCQ